MNANSVDVVLPVWYACVNEFWCFRLQTKRSSAVSSRFLFLLLAFQLQFSIHTVYHPFSSSSAHCLVASTLIWSSNPVSTLRLSLILRHRPDAVVRDVYESRRKLVSAWLCLYVDRIAARSRTGTASSCLSICCNVIPTITCPITERGSDATARVPKPSNFS